MATVLGCFEAEHVGFRLPRVTISPPPLLLSLGETGAGAALSVSTGPLMGAHWGGAFLASSLTPRIQEGWAQQGRAGNLGQGARGSRSTS